MPNIINILVDYREKFGYCVRYWDASLDLEKLQKFFELKGYRVKIWSFHEASEHLKEFAGQVVLYQSSDDEGGWYKSYIEDVILALEMSRAILIPGYRYLRAHHNKSFMELLRKALDNPSIQIPTHIYGTYEDYQKDIGKFESAKWVLKPAAGACSTGVALLSTDRQRRTLPKSISRVIDATVPRILVKHLLRFRYRDYKKKSFHRKKFILQEYIEGLKGDYKVLVYGSKYYVLARANRDDDFRASGSGLFDSDPKLPEGFLDYCAEVSKIFDTPMISMDLGWKDGRCYLLEFQFIKFGTYTLEKSEFYYTRTQKGWSKIYEKSDLEQEYVNSVDEFLRQAH